MIRRDFLKNTAMAGSLAVLPVVGSSISTAAVGSPPALAGFRPGARYDFRTYRNTTTACPVYAITPDDGYYLHTFYDVNPWSPSQRYFACTKFPFQDREPDHRDEAQVCVIDMTDRTLTEVHSTSAWNFQLGSNVQWGSTDRHLYFNDRVDGEVVCMRLDLETGKVKIDRFTDFHDCGTPINPQAVHGQVEGAIVMGAGETVMEEVQFDAHGA